MLKKIIGGILGMLIVLAVIFYILNQKSSNESVSVSPEIQKSAVIATKPMSRVWMEYTEDIVREKKPTPVESARLYAYVATAYGKTLSTTKSSAEASLVAREVLNALLPANREKTDNFFQKNTDPNKDPTILSSEAEKIKEELLKRIANDGFTSVWDGTRPSGDMYWNGENPFTPLAGTWKRWIVSDADTIIVPPPVVWNSEIYKKELAVVKKASDERTPEQSSAVNFWGGAPGTEAPAGIWQNRFYDETVEYNLTDEEYSYAQMVLAQTLADSFMECWKVKYTYWTRRPSMDDTTIDLAMKNPNFPSYVSGHSTISRAATEILKTFFPEKSAIWIADAEEAKNSRLWAGIHFSYDNDEGFALGEKIGKIAVSRLSLKPLK